MHQPAGSKISQLPLSFLVAVGHVPLAAHFWLIVTTVLWHWYFIWIIFLHKYANKNAKPVSCKRLLFLSLYQYSQYVFQWACAAPPSEEDESLLIRCRTNRFVYAFKEINTLCILWVMRISIHYDPATTGISDMCCCHLNFRLDRIPTFADKTAKCASTSCRCPGTLGQTKWPFWPL